MNFSISGFGRTQADSRNTIPTQNNRAVAPRKSVVQVQFPCFGHSLAYYNDQFDLHQGDRVYVDGKLEGEIGVVTSVAPLPALTCNKWQSPAGQTPPCLRRLPCQCFR